MSLRFFPEQRKGGVFAVFALLFAALLLAGCTNSRGGTVPYDVANFGAPDSERIAPPVDTTIGVQDVINVSVYQLTDFNRDVQVDTSGNITLPLVGTVAAAGRTAPQLQQDIAGKLATYVRQPSVLVTVKESVAKSVTIEGSVTRPGLYPVAGQITLLQAIALGGGPSESANPRRVVIFRNINGQRQAAAFDLVSIRRAESPDPAVYGNDIVVVDGSNLRQTYRDLIQSVPLLAIFRPF